MYIFICIHVFLLLIISNLSVFFIYFFILIPAFLKYFCSIIHTCIHIYILNAKNIYISILICRCILSIPLKLNTTAIIVRISNEKKQEQKACWPNTSNSVIFVSPRRTPSNNLICCRNNSFLV